MIKGILATDMSFHMKMIEDFKTRKGELSLEKEEDKCFVYEVLIHAADLNNSS